MTLRRRILLFAVFLLLPAIGGGAFLVAGTYAREQAACHFSPALIANLEKNWDAKRRSL